MVSTATFQEECLFRRCVEEARRSTEATAATPHLYHQPRAPSSTRLDPLVASNNEATHISTFSHDRHFLPLCAWEQVVLPFKLLMTLVPICAGVALSNATDSEVSAEGAFWALAGLLAAAGYQVLVKSTQENLQVSVYVPVSDYVCISLYPSLSLSLSPHHERAI